jgi:hypothetical protein
MMETIQFILGGITVLFNIGLTAVLDVYFGARALTKTRWWAKRILERRTKRGICNCATCLSQSGLPADLWEKAE